MFAGKTNRARDGELALVQVRAADAPPVLAREQVEARPRAGICGHRRRQSQKQTSGPEQRQPGENSWRPGVRCRAIVVPGLRWSHRRTFTLGVTAVQNPWHVMFWLRNGLGFAPVINYSVGPLASACGPGGFRIFTENGTGSVTFPYALRGSSDYRFGCSALGKRIMSKLQDKVLKLEWARGREKQKTSTTLLCRLCRLHIVKPFSFEKKKWVSLKRRKQGRSHHPTRSVPLSRGLPLLSSLS